jgi:hypothetical protein
MVFWHGSIPAGASRFLEAPIDSLPLWVEIDTGNWPGYNQRRYSFYWTLHIPLCHIDSPLCRATLQQVVWVPVDIDFAFMEHLLSVSLFVIAK